MATLVGYCIKLAEHCIAQWVFARPRLVLIPLRKDEIATRKQNAFVSSARRHNRR